MPIVAGLILIALVLYACGDSTEKVADYCDDTTAAFVMSQTFVKKQLRAPSTAEFPYSSAEGVSSRKTAPCKYNVIGYVDAQNAFGAMIRQRYFVEIEYLPGRDVWRLLDLEMP